MVKQTIAISELINVLNELIKIDPTAISALFSLRISCNEALAKHQTVQVGLLGKSHPILGMIGLLNGIFGADKNKWGHICADYEDGKITSFRLLSEKDTTKFESKKKK